MFVIFVLSSIPGEIVDATVMKSSDLQVLGHFLLFILLCISFFKSTKNILLSILLTFAYALFDEAHQYLTPLRSSSWKDVGVDTMGAFISGLFLWKILPTLPKKLKDLLLK